MPAVSNPPSRFHGVHVEWDEPPLAKLRLIHDDSRSILSRNNSPDLSFSYSVNPYRGCTHSCAYCYAREHHEFLDLGAGTDFERVILVKHEAPELLERAFLKRSWRGETVMFSGATDCYQPLERRYELTRGCVDVCRRYRNPIHVVTRSPLVTRDLDLLVELAQLGAVGVSVSIPIPEARTCRLIEPGTAPPEARFATVKALADAGVPVGVSLMPMIPGLNDHMIPEGLQRAKQAGARWVWTGLVRLSGPVAPVFEARLRQALPERADRVMAGIRRARGGALNDPRFGKRMKGRGQSWQATLRLFELWKRRLDFEGPPQKLEASPFRRPARTLTPGPQLGLPFLG